MKILSVPQIQKADQYTIKNEPITSIDLMERASRTVAQWILKSYSKKCKICVLAGSGNNGGDGLAVARLLKSYGYKVTVLLVMGNNGSNDFNLNLNRLFTLNIPIIGKLKEFNQKPAIYVDAIFGSGLSREIEGAIAEVIQEVNKIEAEKIAIDMPSGLYADKASTSENIFKAHHTLSFQLPKLAFMMPENYQYVGEWHVLDIQLHAGYLDDVETGYHWVQPSDFMLPQISPFSHKGTRGRGTIIAGAYGKMGASIIALKGALHSGIGLLTAQVCCASVNVVQLAIPEVLIVQDENEYVLGTFHDYSNQDVVVIGPAIGFANKTKALFIQLLKTYKGQLIIDADAITMLAEDQELLQFLPEGSILTPHIGEFDRLLGESLNHFERLFKLKEFCRTYKVVMILKGKNTAVCSADGEISFNSSGNAGMAKGGSGDLLCGILAGTDSFAKNTFVCAKLAVFLHGSIGDYAQQENGDSYMNPSGWMKFINRAKDSLIE